MKKFKNKSELCLCFEGDNLDYIKKKKKKAIFIVIVKLFLKISAKNILKE